MSNARHWDQDKEATVYVGNIDERLKPKHIWELMIQAGRIQNVYLPKDRVLQTHQGYGFVEFLSEQEADYAANIMNGIRLHGKPLRVNKASADKQRNVDVGAELFIGNLDSMVTESVLYDTFSRFGPLVSPPKIARDEGGMSKGYGFVSFGTFEASDDAIAKMHGRFLMNKEINVQYAYKKDGQGKRHGDEAERKLAAQAQKNNVLPPTPSFTQDMPGQQQPLSSIPHSAGGSVPGLAHGRLPQVMPPQALPPSYSHQQFPSPGLMAGRPNGFAPPQHPQYGHAAPGIGQLPPGVAPPGFPAPPPGFGQAGFAPPGGQPPVPPHGFAGAPGMPGYGAPGYPPAPGMR